MKVVTILTNVELGNLDLPRFQRGYVWKRRQVRAFFDSLYRGHPVGSLLTWVTQRDNGTSTELLLDGQQRVTSLYGVIKGRAPSFFSGDERAFTGLRFHVGSEKFEFYQPIKMKDDPLWFDVTEVMRADTGGVAQLLQLKLHGASVDESDRWDFMSRSLRLLNVAKKDFHIEQIADEGKSIETVVDIFNRLNSAGTTLSRGDLALARIAAKWPGVRKEMRRDIKRWKGHGFRFTLDWLLRCVNAVVNGEAAFQHLHDTPGGDVKDGLRRTVAHVNAALDHIGSLLGLDHDRVLFGRFAIPVIVRHLELRPPGVMAAGEWNHLLYWYLQAGMRGRFSGTTETKIRQDLVQVNGTPDGIERLIGDIGTKWGRRQIVASDFDAWSLGARLYPALYWLTRVGGGRNFCDGMELKAGLLAKKAKMEVHHIFPKAVLYGAGYSRREVNAIGNMCFLTAECNKWIGAAAPAEPSRHVKGWKDPDLRRIGKEGYFRFVEEQNPGVLESQWIPMDQNLWKIANYPAFLEARRRLLAGAANRHLRALYPGHPTQAEEVGRDPAVAPPAALPAHVSSVDEERILDELQAWMSERGLDSGAFGYELLDSRGEKAAAIVDLAWPLGLPEGRGRPVALLLNESAETYRTVSQAGYDVHTGAESFRRFVEAEILGDPGVAV